MRKNVINMNSKNNIFAKLLILPVLFFIISLALIGDYGISWDEPIHWHRGQAYLHYFLTGKTTFADLPKIADFSPKYEGQELDPNAIPLEKSSTKRSYYQHDSLTTEYFLENDSGHPPLNDILAAGTNYVFYQKLQIMGDIASHHLFNILASTLLVFVVVAFGYQTYGLWVGLIAGISLITYPLFFAESQFNIKDPPQTAFFALAIWSFWNSTKRGNWKWLTLSVIATGFAFGMKFNILFLPFILLPFILLKFIPYFKAKSNIVKNIRKIPKLYLLLLILSPCLVAIIFILPWPYLWQDPVHNFLKIFGYYKEIGTGSEAQHAYLGLGPFNIYPLYWILITTPIPTLLLAGFGIIGAFKSWGKHNYAGVLWLAWLVVPILRVTIPGSSIYGGIRQIFEYIPALALLSGLGAALLVTKFKLYKRLAYLFIVVLFISNALALIRLHPNQNVYFNSLIGGLKGAQEAHIPYYGNSFGNAYWQAIQWLNQNAKEGEGFGLIQGTGLNIPRIMLRNDLQYWNGYWSGIYRNGEYMMELTHDDPVKAYPYAWDYVEKFLEPVYEVKVEGVALAKIWKNDLENSVARYQKDEIVFQDNKIIIEDTDLTVELPQEVELTRLALSFKEDASCAPVAGRIFTSFDGQKWEQEAEPVPFPQISGALSLSEGQMNYFFAGKKAKFVRFSANSNNSCVFRKPQVVLYAI